MSKKFAPSTLQLRKLTEFSKCEFQDLPGKEDARLTPNDIVAKAWFQAVERLLVSSGYEIVKKVREGGDDV